MFLSGIYGSVGQPKASKLEIPDSTPGPLFVLYSIYIYIYI